jgi:hypothetical protein
LEMQIRNLESEMVQATKRQAGVPSGTRVATITLQKQV